MNLPIMTLWIVAALLLCLVQPLWADEAADADQAYVKRFLETFPKVASPPTFDAYATPARYDELYMGEKLEPALQNVSNDRGGIAWGTSYRMISLNDMYHATHDAKYLAANLRCIRAVLAVTDDKIGKKLWNGRVVAAWGCDIYAERGRALHAVHTGIITAPMFEFALLAKSDAAFMQTAGADVEEVLNGATAALAEHDRQWRDGPEEGAGHYVGLDQENSLEGKPLPGNRLSAMGWALWASWKVSGNTAHRDRALALGRYIKHRLVPSPDGAYYWSYSLPAEPVTESKPREAIAGEDSSHGGLTMALPLALAEDGQVFTADDLKRVGLMIMNGFGRLGGGILFGNVTGNPKIDPKLVCNPSHWLPFTKAEPKAKDCIIAFYLNYKPTPSAYELAQLLRYAR
jgi:hypothetical protein